MTDRYYGKGNKSASSIPKIFMLAILTLSLILGFNSSFTSTIATTSAIILELQTGAIKSAYAETGNNSADKVSSPERTMPAPLLDNIERLAFDAFSSVYRMILALIISLVIALIVGISAAKKANIAKIVVPILDILQSVPILGFFPAAIAIFLTLFQGSIVGVELASIFLIVTSMVWNMIFSVYESILSIPRDMQETVRAFMVDPVLEFRRLLLPASLPKLIYNSMLSWAAGWYFLTAAEIISLGSTTYTLPGLGSLLAESVAKADYSLALSALATMIGIIFAFDILLWRPLESYSNKFKYDYSVASTPTEEFQNVGRRLRGIIMPHYPRTLTAASRQILERSAFPLVHLSEFFIRNPRTSGFAKGITTTFIKISSRYGNLIFSILDRIYKRTTKVDNSHYHIQSGLALLIILALSGVVLWLELDTLQRSFAFILNRYSLIISDPENAQIISDIPSALLFSYLRLLAAYLLSLAWTIPVAINLAKNPKIRHMMPMFQTAAAIPAAAFFPFMAALATVIPGGLEFPSILLILTGMQWYMLFNLIGGARSVPADIEETAKAFRLTKFQYLRKVLFPSMYPSFVTGSITSWGGGWNSLVVAEYIVFGDKKYSVLGIGALIDKAAYDNGNTLLLLLIVGVMVAIVFTINRLIWRRLYAMVIKKYSMSG